MNPRERAQAINRLLSSVESRMASARSEHAVSSLTDDSIEPLLVLHREVLKIESFLGDARATIEGHIAKAMKS